MANYVFLDKERKNKIYANDDNIMKYKSVRCYCKNPKCDARMFIYMPEHKDSAYFKASGNPGHTGACGIAPYHFSKSDYDEKAFVFPDTLLGLLSSSEHRPTSSGSGSGSGISLRPLSGLKETYNMLTNTAIDDIYNGFAIRDMIADERTVAIYKDKIESFKIVECNFYKYSDDANVIYMNYPTFPNQVRTVELWFDNVGLYSGIKNRIKGKGHNGIVVVFGNWICSEVDKTNYVRITSEKQIAVIKKES